MPVQASSKNDNCYGLLSKAVDLRCFLHSSRFITFIFMRSHQTRWNESTNAYGPRDFLFTFFFIKYLLKFMIFRYLRTFVQHLYINFEFDKKKGFRNSIEMCTSRKPKVLICQKEEKGQQKSLIFDTFI